MERYTKFKTKDDHVIYGILNTSNRSSETLAIFVHGLTGHPNEHTFFNASRLFPKKGIDVFRFYLYAGEKGGRKLSECTIATHAKDLDTVISHFRKKYKTIAVIGHSLGGPTILKSDFLRVDNIILWDPSCHTQSKKYLPKKVRMDNREVCIDEWGTEFLVNPKMFEELFWFNGKNEIDLIRKIRVPFKVIVAGKTASLNKGGKIYCDNANGPKELVVIKKAGHTFDEEGVEENLLSETLSWIKKYS
ncbi:MAG: alpha/beta hydrolase [Candidatus Paceibacterota bacterium]